MDGSTADIDVRCAAIAVLTISPLSVEVRSIKSLTDYAGPEAEDPVRLRRANGSDLEVGPVRRGEDGIVDRLRDGHGFNSHAVVYIERGAGVDGTDAEPSGGGGYL